MHRSSMFGIKLDLKRSKGAFIYDLGRNEFLLDLFGLYSSLPLGYNHPIFDEDSFKEEILAAAHVKIPNCEMATPEGDRFLEAFSNHPSMKPFKYFHFACTGALAIEAAIKTSIDHRGSKRPRVITFKESFHGINGYGGILTHRFAGVLKRLEGFPGHYWGEPLDNPVVRYRAGEKYVDEGLRAGVLERIRAELRNDPERNVAAVLVEPIQCTAGDQYFDLEFLRNLRALCTEFDVPLVFDEVQTGFGATGTIWYFEQCGFVPDIVAFGKKTQTSGIMVREPFGKIFDTPVRLEVTWDGDVLDMIRCRYVLEAYRRFKILDNVDVRSDFIGRHLRSIGGIQNVRNAGLLFAFDFDTTYDRDAYVRAMRERQTVVLATQERTVRWRPHLAFTADETELAVTRTAEALSALTQTRGTA
ncbi:MAG TPA: aminotransferase class III-fold pyridoxal phosphate-dependent enzyme [Terriglobia bacterium]|nr:aminotransferase class III-fold pyridoxal phosphate-dependent enzyme [Terriglobia bacterium]